MNHVIQRQPRATSRSSRWVTTLKLVGVLVVVVGAICAGFAERSTLRQGFQTMERTQIPWLVAAIGAEAFSMVAFACLQRGLLRAGGARLTLPWLLSTAYRANALAISVPLIGSGMATAYAYRQFRNQRVDPTMAKAALALAAGVSTTTFAAVVVFAAVCSGDPGAAVGTLVSTSLLLVFLAVVASLLRSAKGRAALQRSLGRLVRVAQRVTNRPRGDADYLVAKAMTDLGRFRLRPASLAAALGWGTLNWIADAACLVFAIKALGLTTPWQYALLAWSAGQAAASLSPTPDGIGVVEVAMTSVLVSAGVHAPEAIASVLLYRIISLKASITGLWIGLQWVSLHRGRIRGAEVTVR